MAHNPNHDGAMRRGQLSDSRPRLANKFGRSRLAFGVRLLRGQVTAGAKEEVQRRGLVIDSAQASHGGIPRNRVEPCRDLRIATEAQRVLPHLHEYILNDFFGVRGAGQDSQDDREHGTAMPPDELGERVFVARGDRFDER